MIGHAIYIYSCEVKRGITLLHEDAPPSARNAMRLLTALRIKLQAESSRLYAAASLSGS